MSAVLPASTVGLTNLRSIAGTTFVAGSTGIIGAGIVGTVFIGAADCKIGAGLPIRTIRFTNLGSTT